jgi:hypothetical protein
MSGAQKEDRLEEFFRSRLERYEEDPQEGMWGRISGSIPPRPAAPWWATIKGWLWPGSMALLLLALIAVLWQSRQLQDLSLRLEEHNRILETIQGEITRENERSEAPGFDKETNIDRESGAEEFFKNTATPRQWKGSLPFDGGMIQIFEKTNGTDFTQITMDDRMDGEELPKTSSAADPVFTPMNPAAPIPRLDPNLLEAGVESIIPREESARDYPRFFYTLFYEPGYTRFPGVLFGAWSGSGANSSSSTAGVSAGLQLGPKLSVQTGAAFKTIQFRIEESADLNYTAESAVPDAEGRPTRWYELETAGGPFLIRSQIANQLSNDGNDISEGDPFQLSLDVRYRLRYFSIPLWVRYELGGDRWKVYLKGGGNAHLLTGDKTRIAKANSSFERLRPGRATVQVKGLEDVYLEAGAGPGLTYEWTQRVNLGMEALFYHSLSPIATDNNWSFGLNFNVNFKL